MCRSAATTAATPDDQALAAGKAGKAMPLTVRRRASARLTASRATAPLAEGHRNDGHDKPGLPGPKVAGMPSGTSDVQPGLAEGGCLRRELDDHRFGWLGATPHQRGLVLDHGSAPSVLR
jgi:hypothetical protein